MMNTRNFKTIGCILSGLVIAMLFGACWPSDSGGSGGTSVPNVPTDVTAVAVSSTSITITWKLVPGATSYEVHREIGSARSKITTVTGNTYTDTDLEHDTTYKYYIAAKNDAGTSDLSTPDSATTPIAPKPTTPKGLTAVAVSSSSIRITWNPVTGAKSYDVYYWSGYYVYDKFNFIGNTTSTEYIHSDLQSNTTHYYSVRAKNDSDVSNLSDYVEAKTPVAEIMKPAIPTGVTPSVQSSTSIRITWNPVSTTTSYDVYYAIGSSSSSKTFAGNIYSPPYNHNYLQPDTTYFYFIKAKNGAGDSDFSSAVSAKTQSSPTTTPASPTGVVATAQSSTGILVTWNPVSTATSYDVYYAFSNSSSSAIFVGNVPSPPYTHINLQPNTAYYYFIKSKNSAGDSGFSSSASAKTSVPEITKPTSPTGVSASLLPPNSIRVIWNPVSNASGYDIYFTINSPTGTKNTASENLKTTSYTHSGLLSETTYYYFIKAYNSAGYSDFSSYDSITTPIILKPNAPTGVTAKAQSSSSIIISWNSVSDATSYDIYYTVGSSSEKSLPINVSSNSYTHSSLQPETTYNYFIKAKNSAGDSDFSSDSASATTQAPPITKPAVPVGISAVLQPRRIIVTWTAVSGATSYEVYYSISRSSVKTYAGTVSGTSYSHTNFQDNTSYEYFIRAKNSSSVVSDFSSSVNMRVRT
jgi:titin